MQDGHSNSHRSSTRTVAHGSNDHNKALTASASDAKSLQAVNNFVSNAQCRDAGTSNFTTCTAVCFLILLVDYDTPTYAMHSVLKLDMSGTTAEGKSTLTERATN